MLGGTGGLTCGPGLSTRVGPQCYQTASLRGLCLLPFSSLGGGDLIHGRSTSLRRDVLAGRPAGFPVFPENSTQGSLSSLRVFLFCDLLHLFCMFCLFDKTDAYCHSVLGRPDIGLFLGANSAPGGGQCAGHRFMSKAHKPATFLIKPSAVQIAVTTDRFNKQNVETGVTITRRPALSQRVLRKILPRSPAPYGLGLGFRGLLVSTRDFGVIPSFALVNARFSRSRHHPCIDTPVSLAFRDP